MKAKTKIQKAVAGSIKLLPPLSDFQRKEAIGLMPHIAKLSAKGVCTCLDCAHSWTIEGKPKSIACPNCGRMLQVETDRRSVFKCANYLAVVTRFNGFQVVRMFLANASYRKGTKAEYEIVEVFQRWISTNGDNVIVSLSRRCFSWYIDVWNFDSKMEIRTENEAHAIGPVDIIGRISAIPELKRNGFKGDFHCINPYRLINALLTNPKFETMIKSGQVELLRHFVKSGYKLEHYWPAIRIAIRNHYKVADASLWTDLIDALVHCGKDIRNSKFVCPLDLKATHDHWNRKREEKRRRERERLERERYLADLEQQAIDQENYIKSKSRFFDIAITDGTITIKVLDSVKAFFEEGNTLKHCVAQNKYYNKENSLILSASIGNQHIETLEISLSSLEIIQCRGLHNSNSIHHDRILNLMKANIQEVAKRLRA